MNRSSVGMSKGDAISKFFPPSPRVMYGKAPLFEVVCQLHFPRILKIEGSVPADFQDSLRDKFPLFEPGAKALKFGEGPAIPAEIAQILGQVNHGAYHFVAEDRSSTISLTPETVGLSVKNYSRWEDFICVFEIALSALERIYKPSFYTRVGLRYRDLIDRKKLGLEGERWGNLLNDALIGELADAHFEDAAKEVRRIVRLAPSNDSITVLLQHGLNAVVGSNEIGYVIDFDFSCSEKTEVKDVRTILGTLHNCAGQAFRWCIKDKLHDALDPQPVE